MKNIKLFIGFLMFALQLPLSILAQPGITSDRNVKLIHGLGDQGGMQPFANFFTGQDNRRMFALTPNYVSGNGLDAAANQIPINSSPISNINSDANTVFIGHSLGGVITRHLNNSNAMAGIITVGSPLDGAPIANAVLDGRVTYAVNDGATQLLRGPLATIGFINPLLTLFGHIVQVTFLSDEMGKALNRFSNSTIVNDIKVGGSAIEQDKAASPTSTPKISIWGNENSPVHWNLLTSLAPGQDVAQTADALSTIYEVSFFVHLGIGASLWYSPWGWWALWASYEWYNGWQWISNDSERVWNNLIGSDMVALQCYNYPSLICYYPDTRYCENHPGAWNCQLTCDPITLTSCAQVHSNGMSDSFIPITSQRGEGSSSWRTGSGGNHQDEVDANNGEMQAKFNTIFAAAGVDQVFRIDRR
jgi:hypothetical protein